MQSRKAWKPELTLVGVRPSLNLLAYCDQITTFIPYCLLGLMVTWCLIAESIFWLKIIEHPFKNNLPLLQQNWPSLEMIFLYSISTSVFVWIEGKRSIKSIKGLLSLTRADRDQFPPERIMNYVEVHMPSWLKRLPQVDLPEDVLDTIQQHVSSDQPWMKNFRTYLKENTPELVSPMSIQVSVGDRITISVHGSGSKSQKNTITQYQTAAIIGRLALQEKGAWMLRKDVIEPIYGEDEQNVTKHISRLNEVLNKAVQKVLTQLNIGEGDQSFKAQDTPIKLVEYDETGKENFWRLLITCEVEIFPELISLYEQLRSAQINPTSLPDHESLYRACRHIMDHYGKGLFGSYQRKYLGQYQYWPWATEYFTEYQNKCLYVLQTAVKRESQYAVKHKNEAEVLQTSIRQTAQLYSWIVQVALGAIPNLVEAERAIGKCLNWYHKISDLSRARSIFQIYATFMKQGNEAWVPSEKFSNIWPEATLLPMSDAAD
jgi:hypothetical protein